jgi:Holliday junction resolvase RusA-like endonuclease
MSIKEAYLQANQEVYMNPETPLAIVLTVYQQIPKSVSKKKKQEMLDGKIRPTKKPDIDNILKSVLDSLNQVAFHDDTQIVSVEVVKWYDETPRMVVKIFELNNTEENK